MSEGRPEGRSESLVLCRNAACYTPWVARVGVPTPRPSVWFFLLPLRARIWGRAWLVVLFKDDAVRLGCLH